jgi:broad specificity phosphatase PhoE
VVDQIFLIRHGETPWSLSGQHTGNTDMALTERGERQAKRLGELLRSQHFSAVFSSPLQRARRTCELAGLGGNVQIDEGLREWNYGEYEGLTSPQIRARRASWDVFRDGCPGGESPQQMQARVDGVVARLRAQTGTIAVFSHGHCLRSLAVRWIELPILNGRNFGLAAGAVSRLGYQHHSLEEPAIELWNAATDVP